MSAVMTTTMSAAMAARASGGSPGAYCRLAVLVAVVADSVGIIIREIIADTVFVCVCVAVIVTDAISVFVHKTVVSAHSVSVHVREAIPHITSADTAGGLYLSRFYRKND